MHRTGIETTNMNVNEYERKRELNRSQVKLPKTTSKNITSIQSISHKVSRFSIKSQWSFELNKYIILLLVKYQSVTLRLVIRQFFLRVDVFVPEVSKEQGIGCLVGLWMHSYESRLLVNSVTLFFGFYGHRSPPGGR